jgi:uncharacterized protein involved in outer membrane biogenesis
MPRLRLAVPAVLIILAASGALYVRSLLNPDTLRRAAEARVSALLGQPVTIGSVQVSMWPAPAVVGSEIAVGTDPRQPELALSRIHIVPSVISLLRGPYIIREVTLEGLTLRVVREPLGRWRFPTAVPAPGSAGDGGLTIERVRLAGGRVRVFQLTAREGMDETSAIDDIEGEAIADAAGLRIERLTGRVGRSAIAGSVTVQPQAARVALTMPRIEGEDLSKVMGLAAADAPAFVALAQPAAVSFDATFDRVKGRLSGTGTLHAPEVTFFDLRLQGLQAPIQTDGVRLTFAPAAFTMYGGAHRGTMVVDLSRTPARWALDSHVDNLRVADFLAALTARAANLDGVAAAAGALRAGVGDPMPRSLEGRLQVTVANGVIRNFPLLSAINRALRLAEGDSRDTRFERLSATLTFPGATAASGADAGSAGHATTDDLVMLAREVRVEAGGRLGFDRSLDLTGQAVLSPERTAQAVRSIRELSGLRNDRGELELPLTIRGTLDNPAFGIDIKSIAARSLKEELRRRVRDFIRRVPREDD